MISTMVKSEGLKIIDLKKRYRQFFITYQMLSAQFLKYRHLFAGESLFILDLLLLQ